MSSESIKNYRKNPASYKKKLKKDKEINARPEQRAKRSELVKERRKRGIYGKGGKDIHHAKGGKLVLMDKSKNRGMKEKSRVKGYKSKRKSKN